MPSLSWPDRDESEKRCSFLLLHDSHPEYHGFPLLVLRTADSSGWFFSRAAVFLCLGCALIPKAARLQAWPRGRHGWQTGFSWDCRMTRLPSPSACELVASPCHVVSLHEVVTCQISYMIAQGFQMHKIK